jgi:hypothetical protein
MIIKELKFIGLLLFIIFAILLLVVLVFFITYQRFQCSEYINHMKNIPISGKIETIIPFLKTGDLIISSDCLSKNLNNIKCFRLSRGNFTKNSYHYTHIAMIYRKENKIFLIDNINYDNICSKIFSMINPKYKSGLRIVNFYKYIKEIKENTKKHNHCCQNYAIRFINKKLNQNELNKRLENEFNILSDKNFNNLKNVYSIAISGWFIKDAPNNFQYATEIFYPNDEKDTFFCSEIIGVLLQRIGVMKRINRSRMFYPSDFNGSNDDKMFEKGMYSKIEIYS